MFYENVIIYTELHVVCEEYGVGYPSVENQ